MWSQFEKEHHINWLELHMVWDTLARHKDELEGRRVLFEVDNLTAKFCVTFF